MNTAELPRYCFGTWAIGGGDSWGECDEKESESSLRLAMDSGFTWFDTAPAYGNGLSETILGRAMRSQRDRIMITSKCGLVWDEKGSMVHKQRDGVTVYRNLTPDSIRRQLEQSLRRLGTDYIDVYVTHHQNPADSLDDAVDCLLRLIEEGKIGAFGISNSSISNAEGYCAHSKPLLDQEGYSILNQSKSDLLRFAESNGIYFQAYSPLERGLLTGHVSPDAQIIGAAKQSNPWFERGKIIRINKMLESVGALAMELDVSVGVLVCAYTASLSPAMGLCIGGRTRKQVEENSKLLSFSLSDEVRRKVSGILAESDLFE